MYILSKHFILYFVLCYKYVIKISTWLLFVFVCLFFLLRVIWKYISSMVFLVYLQKLWKYKCINFHFFNLETLDRIYQLFYLLKNLAFLNVLAPVRRHIRLSFIRLYFNIKVILHKHRSSDHISTAFVICTIKIDDVLTTSPVKPHLFTLFWVILWLAECGHQISFNDEVILSYASMENVYFIALKLDY